MERVGFDAMFLFRLDDRAPWNASDRDAWYGLLRVDGTKKPAYDVVKEYNQSAR
jgi:hypothetical protein